MVEGTRYEVRNTKYIKLTWKLRSTSFSHLVLAPRTLPLPRRGRRAGGAAQRGARLQHRRVRRGDVAGPAVRALALLARRRRGGEGERRAGPARAGDARPGGARRHAPAGGDAGAAGASGARARGGRPVRAADGDGVRCRALGVQAAGAARDDAGRRGRRGPGAPPPAGGGAAARRRVPGRARRVARAGGGARPARAPRPRGRRAGVGAASSGARAPGRPTAAAAADRLPRHALARAGRAPGGGAADRGELLLADEQSPHAGRGGVSGAMGRAAGGLIRRRGAGQRARGESARLGLGAVARAELGAARGGGCGGARAPRAAGARGRVGGARLARGAARDGRAPPLRRAGGERDSAGARARHRRVRRGAGARRPRRAGRRVVALAGCRGAGAGAALGAARRPARAAPARERVGRAAPRLRRRPAVVGRAVISLRGVRFAYVAGRAGRALPPALDCPSLDIGPGLTLLLGPNGAGKSTLLRVAAGVERPDAGTVTVDGADLWRDEAAARRRLAYVPEHPDLTPYATVEEVVALVGRLRGEPAAATEAALRRVGLEEVAYRSVRELSMGQRRRALLAAALVGDIRTVLLDEPLETMDRAVRDLILTWVRTLASDGRTVVIATHEIEPFVPLAARAISVAGGVPRVVDPLPGDPAERLALLERCARGGAATDRRG